MSTKIFSVGKVISFFIIIAMVGFFLLNDYIYKEKQADTFSDYKNAEYIIDGKIVKLENGMAETKSAPGAASKTITRYFGNGAKGDLNADRIPDLAFILTQDGGGSGTFFYVVGAIQNEDGKYQGTSAVFLGDRIAPQTTEIRDGLLIVNYAIRGYGESFDVQPSIGKSIWLKLDPSSMQFGEVEQNFEGEADPSQMTLYMTKWRWQNVLYKDGTKVEPKEKSVFTILFSANGTFSATTDCNSISGKYSSVDSAISFSSISSTKMYCEGSQEEYFSKILLNSASYRFTSKGELILEFKEDGGEAIFR